MRYAIPLLLVAGGGFATSQFVPAGAWENARARALQAFGIPDETRVSTPAGGGLFNTASTSQAGLRDTDLSETGPIVVSDTVGDTAVGLQDLSAFSDARNRDQGGPITRFVWDGTRYIQVAPDEDVEGINARHNTTEAPITRNRVELLELFDVDADAIAPVVSPEDAGPETALLDDLTTSPLTDPTRAAGLDPDSPNTSSSETPSEPPGATGPPAPVATAPFAVPMQTPPALIAAPRMENPPTMLGPRNDILSGRLLFEGPNASQSDITTVLPAPLFEPAPDPKPTVNSTAPMIASTRESISTAALSDLAPISTRRPPQRPASLARAPRATSPSRAPAPAVTRRATTPVDAPSAPTPSNAARFGNIVGIFETPSDAWALLEGSDGAVRVLREGYQLGETRIVDIYQGHVVIRRDDRRVTLVVGDGL